MFKNSELNWSVTCMAVLRVEFDNILCFKNFKADFSYPKKLVNSNLDSEYLQDYPKIKYKKLNIIIGSNASGKTSLGNAIWKTFMFIHNKEAKPIIDLVTDKEKTASILMDCVFSEGTFFRFEASIKTNGEIFVRYRKVQLLPDDTYDLAIKKLGDGDFEPHIIALENAKIGGWNFNFPSTESGFGFINCKVDPDKTEEFLKILNNVLKTFDPSISMVNKSNETEDTYIIRFDDGRFEIVRDNYPLNNLRQLSSGTKYAINIARVMFDIKNHSNGFYYVDEQFSYANSDIEIACLTSMVELLGDGEQLFFTSHNEELLRLPYPLHSFSFLKKRIDKDGHFVELFAASSFEKRNNVSARNLYDNDYFDLAPDVNKVFEVVN